MQQQVDERLDAIADKYFSRAISAQVTFGKGPYDHSFTCDIVAHVPQGVVLKGSAGAALDAHSAFDQAADRIETQLRRYKRRLKDRHARPRMPKRALEAGYTRLRAAAGGRGAGRQSAGRSPKHRVDIPDRERLRRGDAARPRNTNALMFRNSGTGAFNMVYRRDDGTIGWVEPQRAAPEATASFPLPFPPEASASQPVRR